jgi:hypothetical protein
MAAYFTHCNLQPIHQVNSFSVWFSVMWPETDFKNPKYLSLFVVHFTISRSLIEIQSLGNL